jgi:CrcB protein
MHAKTELHERAENAPCRRAFLQWLQGLSSPPIRASARSKHMERLLWVCLGGAFGSGARYLMSGWVQERLGPGFPWGTFSVNVIGSFLIGLIMEISLATGSVSPLVRLTLTTGVMGGFTTYSTFNYETFAYMQERAWWLAAANILATLLACLAAGLLGQALGRSIAGG